MTTRLRLRTYGDPCLRKVARPVSVVGPAERLLIREMVAAMYAFDGTGLAASQVGVLEMIFVADIGEGPFAIINPQIIHRSGKQTVMEEGCLSFPEIFAEISRPGTVDVRALDAKGKPISFRCGGLLARAVQHETDHLNGILFIDRMTKKTKEEIRDELNALQAATKAELKKK